MIDALEERIASIEHGYVLGRQGLKILRDLSDDEWEALGIELTNRVGGAQWHLGDWLMYGEGRGFYTYRTKAVVSQDDGTVVQGRNHVVAYETRERTGGKYDRAMKLTGLAYETLSEYARTAYAFPMHTRVELSWSRHYDTLPLPSDARLPLMQKCIAMGWGSKEWLGRVRHAIEALRGPETLPVIKRSKKKMIQGIECPFCHAIIPKAKIRLHPVKENK